MASLFFAIYDDAAVTIPFKLVHKSPFTVYRTSNMALIEEISALGLEPTLVLLEEDISNISGGSFQNDDLSPEEMEFLTATVDQWEFIPNVTV